MALRPMELNARPKAAAAKPPGETMPSVLRQREHVPPDARIIDETTQIEED
jgi:hypothetical protein